MPEHVRFKKIFYPPRLNHLYTMCYKSIKRYMYDARKQMLDTIGQKRDYSLILFILFL